MPNRILLTKLVLALCYLLLVCTCSQAQKSSSYCRQTPASNDCVDMYECICVNEI
jgi:hypothetical protein